MTIIKQNRRSIRKQRGLVAVLVTVGFTLMLGFAALAIDVNHMVLSKAKLQNAVDGAALAAATQATMNDSASDATKAATDVLDDYDEAAGNTSFSLPISTSDSRLTIQFSNAANDFPTNGANQSGVSQSDDIYVRVEIISYSLTSYFLGIFGIDKNVTVSAVAGPSNGLSEVGNLFPMAVCKIEDGGPNFGYNANHAYPLKSVANNSLMGSGNYNYLDSGSGSTDLTPALAGNYTDTLSVNADVGDSVNSEPGQKLSASYGTNTRFGDYTGTDTFTPSPSEYLSDIYVGELEDAGYTIVYSDGESFTYMDSSDASKANPATTTISYGNNKGVIDTAVSDVLDKTLGENSYSGKFADAILIYESTAWETYADELAAYLKNSSKNSAPTTTLTNLNTSDSSYSYWGHSDYLSDVESCSTNSSKTGCVANNSVQGRREICMPILSCGEESGKSTYYVEGYGNFFLLNDAATSSNDNTPLVGEYLGECTVKSGTLDNTAGTASGAYTIVLYKDPNNQES